VTPASPMKVAADTPLVDHLAHWVSSFGSIELPANVREQAKCLLLDSMGCALAGVEDHVGASVLEVVKDLGGRAECTIIGAQHKSSILNAVFANGTLIRCLDFNDFYWGPGQVGHPSDNLSVALAAGEKCDRSGLDTLSAIVMGYELYCRIQDCSDPTGPWDHVSASGFVAPAMAALLLGLSERQIADAIAISAAQAHTLACLRDGTLSAAKAVANAKVAQSGTLAALLAANGLTGPRESLDGRRGLSAGLLNADAAASLRGSFDGGFRLLDVSIKAYPCVGVAQTPVSAALKAREVLGGDHGQIISIDLHLPNARIARGQLDDGLRHPSSRESADHSCYFLIAIAMVDGEVTIRQFEGERWNDPTIRRLMDRITVHPDLPIPSDGASPCRLIIKTVSGERHVIEMPYALGHPRNPLSFDEVASKLRAGAGPTPSNVIARLVEGVGNIESMSSIRQLMTTLQFSTVEERNEKHSRSA
jgi:2-methylcitrate dehydratase